MDGKTLNRCKIHQKFLCTVTTIASQPLKTHRQPRWLMKDNGHSYLFKKILVLIPGLVWRPDRNEINYRSCNAFSGAENMHFPHS